MSSAPECPRCPGPEGEDPTRRCSGVGLGYGETPHLCEACGEREAEVRAEDDRRDRMSRGDA